MTTQPTPNTELMQQNRSLPYYDGGELRSKAPRRPQSTTGGPPRAWFRSGIAVLVSVLFVGLAGINLLAQLRYSVTGRQAVGTVVEFHFSAGRSRSVTAQVDVALGDRPVFRWEVQDPFGLQAWAPRSWPIPKSSVSTSAGSASVQRDACHPDLPGPTFHLGPVLDFPCSLHGLALPEHGSALPEIPARACARRAAARGPPVPTPGARKDLGLPTGRPVGRRGRRRPGRLRYGCAPR